MKPPFSFSFQNTPLTAPIKIRRKSKIVKKIIPQIQFFLNESQKKAVIPFWNQEVLNLFVPQKRKAQ